MCDYRPCQVAGALAQPSERYARLGQSLVQEMNRTISDLGIEGSCVYGDGSIFHVLLGKGASANPDGMLVPNCVDTLTLRQGNAPEVKAALQAGLLKRGVDILGGQAGIISTAHTEEDVGLTATAFGETLREMRENGLLS